MNETLDTSQLMATVNMLDDFDDALSALHALADLDKTAAEKLALEILVQQKGDVYFQASCFDVLYSTSLQRALEYMKENVRHVDVYLLGTMMSNVAEDLGIIQEHPEIKDAVIILKKSVLSRSAAEIESIRDDLDWFNQTYP
ncbi:hypothetical protein ACO0LF_17115 [Undibacterium sp. Di27W]|uniref:hypothetical protein n=1 Tax=Undibacterium sp. Di27W TaxID=3413036 RepID=UPI003BEF73BF